RRSPSRRSLPGARTRASWGLARRHRGALLRSSSLVSPVVRSALYSTALMRLLQRGAYVVACILVVAHLALCGLSAVVLRGGSDFRGLYEGARTGNLYPRSTFQPQDADHPAPGYLQLNPPLMF